MVSYRPIFYDNCAPIMYKCLIFLYDPYFNIIVCLYHTNSFSFWTRQIIIIIIIIIIISVVVVVKSYKHDGFLSPYFL